MLCPLAYKAYAELLLIRIVFNNSSKRACLNEHVSASYSKRVCNNVGGYETRVFEAFVSFERYCRCHALVFLSFSLGGSGFVFNFVRSAEFLSKENEYRFCYKIFGIIRIY